MENKKRFELTDDQLEQVAGGAHGDDGDRCLDWCPQCGHVWQEYRDGDSYCTVCGQKSSSLMVAPL